VEQKNIGVIQFVLHILNKCKMNNKKTYIILFYIILIICIYLIINFIIKKNNNPDYFIVDSISMTSEFVCIPTNKKNFLWNIKTGKIIYNRYSCTNNTFCTISLDEKFFIEKVLDNKKSTIKIYDILKNKLIIALPGSSYVCFSPDSKYMAWENYIYKIENDNFKKQITLDNFPKTYIYKYGSLLKKVDNHWLVIISKSEKEKKTANIQLFDINKNKIYKEIKIFCDGKQGFVLGENKVFVFYYSFILIIDMYSNKIYKIKHPGIEFKSSYKSYCVSNDGNTIVISDYIVENNPATVYELTPNGVVNKSYYINLRKGRLINTMALRNEILVVGYRLVPMDSNIYMYNIKTGREIGKLKME